MQNLIKAAYNLLLNGDKYLSYEDVKFDSLCYFIDFWSNRFMKTPQDSEVINTYIVQPPQTNMHGTAFGGQIMAWMDETAAIVALRHANKPCVTASVDQVQFTKPIAMGHVVIMKSRVNYAGSSSMEIGVRVCSENPLTGERQHCLSGYLTFVAVNEEGRPVEVPDIKPMSKDDLRRYREGRERRQVRLDSRNN